MPSSTLCVDASLVVRLLNRGDEQARILKLWHAWDAAGCAFVAPALLYYEVTNALHRYARAGQISADEAAEYLGLALSLQIGLYGDATLHLHAMGLAGRLGLPAAYDTHYLALAERLGAEFWTADQRLYRAVKPALPWVHYVEDTLD
jgi:predicted nucleic acid-binding protein